MILTIIVGAVVLAGFVGALLWHERREFRRQDRVEAAALKREASAAERHGELMAEVRDMRRLALGAITQRTNLENGLLDLQGVLNDHADLLDARAEPGARPARRPK